MAIITFPKDFRFGASTASYQIEGAYNEDGRGMSIWDTYSRIPGKVRNGDNGDVACDSYHRMDEDIALLKELGVNTYRFSIAWPRIFPEGKGEVNPQGIEHYHLFIDRLLENGIEPMVTIYHWDLPQALQDNGGWKNRQTIDAFADYADLLFHEYGDKVKYWLTINEPWCASFLGHFSGEQAPGEQNLQSALDVAHHLLIAHGKAVRKFRMRDIKGQIGFAPNVTWYEPYSSKQEDRDACKRLSGWFMEWFFGPVFKGSYPQYLVDWFAEKGAHVTIQDGDMEMISEPIDLLGINYYTGTVARYKENKGLFDCEHVDIGYDHTDIGFKIFPEGFYQVLLDIKKKYGDIPICITENGACYNDEPVEGRVKDDLRIKYYNQHLIEVNRAINSGVNVKGYCTWSLLDNFEWAYGYSKRFGLVHVNYNTLARTKKDSFYWYGKLAKNHWFEV
ncbi:broad-specificity cellobiase [Scopulibacillus darangshiensis]|uniref:Beta-glucosidase n=1 Tax=Scopulibacillus darangshiensis TaxID=442528 RepID=A0A4R2P3V8_9BACL|nr:GH1 family beta-glucosidase [Scopulibacillus darangshiensis]TCP29460.1 broad-specificity cellobiase [Scopulibacillus darangshiensis]